MQSGAIPDSAINASSSYDYISVGPSLGRIRSERGGGAWCPKEKIGRDVYEYLEISFPELKMITLIETQGRFGNGQVHTLDNLTSRACASVFYSYLIRQLVSIIVIGLVQLLLLLIVSDFFTLCVCVVCSFSHVICLKS